MYMCKTVPMPTFSVFMHIGIDESTEKEKVRIQDYSDVFTVALCWVSNVGILPVSFMAF